MLYNMNVERLHDPNIVAALAHLDSGTRTILFTGAPGIGKSAALAATVRILTADRQRRAIWITGEAVAGEVHLASLLSGTPPGVRSTEDALSEVCRGMMRDRLVLAVDDLDALVSKRERIAAAFRELLTGPDIVLVGTCHPGAVSRLAGTDGPFTTLPDRDLPLIALTHLGDLEARALILRRAPTLSVQFREAVVNWAGGHPAALVFLSRLAEGIAEREAEFFFNRAAEFAGAVYGEPWSALGPQQRAVLRQLALQPGEAGLVEAGTALGLSPAHVGAQVRRLVDEGLVRRCRERGRYAVAPLLSRWIGQRALRFAGAGGL